MEHVGIKTIAKLVRTQLKKEYPECKFSVTIERFRLGRILNIALMSAPFEGIVAKGYLRNKNGNQTLEIIQEQGCEIKQYGQLNQKAFKNGFDDPRTMPGWNNGNVLSKESWNCMKRVYEIAKSYDDRTFFLDLDIGKWNKPFQKKEAKI